MHAVYGGGYQQTFATEPTDARKNIRFEGVCPEYTVSTLKVDQEPEIPTLGIRMADES
jgi:hypothetical protein